MSQAPAAPADAPATAPFDALDRALRDGGPGAALDLLVRRLDEQGEPRALLDALLLKARHELGLPLVQTGSFAELPEGPRLAYEARYVDAIRTVGRKLLDAGEVAAAWPYYRAISEPEPVARALDAFEPAENDERLNQVVEVAFNQGANPKKGFELILTHYGICSAITAFEHLPRDEATRVACAERLVRELHGHLTANLRGEVAHRGQPLPPDGASIPDLIRGRDWLFHDDAYHVDVSHLSSAVRLAPLLSDPPTVALAVDLTEYGRRLSDRHRFEGDPPFDDVFEDHRVYLRALLGEDVDQAVAHFRAKLPASQEPEADDPDGPVRVDAVPAQVLVGLLVRLGRLDEAIDVASEHLADYPESSLFCPSVSQLCQRAGKPSRLAEIARGRGDLVHYAAAALQGGGRGT